MCGAGDASALPAIFLNDMKKILTITKHTYQQLLRNKAIVVLMILIAILIVYAGIIGLLQYKKAEATRATYQRMVRDNWVSNPDKHPHRMAHYGFIAFRPKSGMSVFDYGLESYTGNAVFLEAHRQNSTNFSEASLSSSMLRFGEISIAMILQVLLPLFIFFTGFNCIAQDRENGTLKILLAQGISWKQLLVGKIAGLASIASLLFVPAMIYAAVLSAFTGSYNWVSLLLAFLLYFAGIFIYCSIAVIVSSISKTSKLSLVLLIGIWLLAVIVLPKATQAIANSVYSIPSKIAFESAIGQDIIKEGDSHDPDDKHYKALKDSVLKANKADSVAQLNFNYSGFQMAEGERISADIYNRHLQRLLDTYDRQNELLSCTGFISPHVGLKQLSMTLSHTDFYTYTNFQEQAEAYRYALAQEMNSLQMKLIPNKKLSDTARNYSIDRKYWKEFSDFNYKQPAVATAISRQRLSLLSILFWLSVVIVSISVLGRTLKPI